MRNQAQQFEQRPAMLSGPQQHLYSGLPARLSLLALRECKHIGAAIGERLQRVTGQRQHVVSATGATLLVGICQRCDVVRDTDLLPTARFIYSLELLADGVLPK